MFGSAICYRNLEWFVNICNHFLIHKTIILVYNQCQCTINIHTNAQSVDLRRRL
jgi:hypothetical protein